MARNWKYELRTTLASGNSIGDPDALFGVGDDDVIPAASLARLAAAITNSTLSINPTLSINDTSDHVINAAESTAVSFSVSGLVGQETGTVTFSDASNRQVVVDVGAGGTYTADLSTLSDGTITSSLLVTDPAGRSASASGNAVSLDTDKDLNPTLSFEGTNPSHAVFTVSGLAGDEHGTVTFTDANGLQDVVQIASNGAYSADLSNLTDGTISYLLSVVDPAGNVTSVDPPLNLGDGSANSPAGTAQLPSLLNSYAMRPSWNVAGVDYHVGAPSGTTLKDPATINMAGVSLHMGGSSGNYLLVSGNNVVLDGYDFSKEGGWQVDVVGNNTTIKNSYFLQQSTAQTPVYFETSAVGGNVLNNTFDGNNGTLDKFGFGLPPIEIIGGGGTFNVEYNYILNSYSDAINIGGNAVTETFNIEYNLIKNVGMGTTGSAHPDFIQTQNSTTYNNTVVDYNTLVQSAQMPQGGTQGITLFQHTGINPTFNGVDVSYNTLIATAMTYTSSTEGVQPWITVEHSELNGTGTVTNNFVDPTGNKGVNGATGLFLVTDNNTGSLNGTVLTSNNVNMLTGSQLGAQSFVSVSNVASSPSNVTEFPGDTITLTLKFSGAVTVTGAPTLKLNDGGTASYAGGSGSNALTFTYTVGASDSTVTDLAITQVNLPTGATIKDASGNAANLTGALATLWGLGIDPPSTGAPTIASFTTDSGTVGDHITNDNTLTLTGTAVANSTVKVYDGATLLNSVLANASGAWTYTTPALANGAHSFTATDTVSGTTSAASSALSVTIDTTAPVAPTIASFTTDSGTAGDHITNDATLTLTGTAEANATVKVYDGATLLNSVLANASGAWTYTTPALANGAHSLTATATDAAGNTGAASSSLTVTVDTTAPVAPGIASFSPDTGTAGDGITTANVLTLTGTAEANATIKIYDGATLLNSVLANASGAWTYTTPALANGAHSLTATATDAAGNTGVASSVLAVTVTAAPGAPTIASFTTDSGTVGDHITNDNTLTLTGTAVANSTVKVYDGATLLNSVLANASGAWTYTTPALANGAHSFTATDTVSGTTSAASSALSVTIDTTAPVAPTIASFTTDSGTAGDHITNDATLTLTGTAVANSTVKVYDGATLLNSVLANASGAWTYTTPALANGAHSLTATATDAAGNTGVASAALAVTVDTIAPNAPVVLSDVIVNTNRVLLTGTAEAGSTVKIFEDAALLGTAAVNGSGVWNYTTNPLPDGAHTFTATSTDAAGNTSFASQYVDPIVGTGTVIDSSGATGLSEIANHYYLLDTANTDVSLKYGGSDYVDGQFGAWTPIGAEKTSTGYEIAWKNGNASQYTIWNVDSNGNYLANVVGAVSGTNSTLESREQSFHQDLNGDGVIGLPAASAVIELAGVTSLTEVGNTFFLNDSITGGGPSLKYGGANFAPGQFDGWTPIGAEKTATGYEVAWKNGSADQYTLWNVDSNGNYISNVFGAVSGSSTTLDSFESAFHQDLNGDGVIGIPGAVIESAAATSLTELGNAFFLDDSITGAGPSLKYGGVNYTLGQFGAWTPIGAEKTAAGYEVAWKNGSADQYTVWNVDNSGNYLSNVVGAVPGTSIQSFEVSFLQDLNGNGHIGSSLVVNGPANGGTLTSTAANEVLFGNGGENTFVFSGTTWGTDIVADFHPTTDVVQLSQAAFANLATALSHAAQVGTDVVITADATDSITLKNTVLSELTTHNIHIV